MIKNILNTVLLAVLIVVGLHFWGMGNSPRVDGVERATQDDLFQKKLSDIYNAQAREFLEFKRKYPDYRKYGLYYTMED